MWSCRDSQEVGLEAATLERVRNSSLVERGCADNVTGLKHDTEAEDTKYGRGAFRQRRRRPGRGVGADGSENAGMSSEKHVRTMFAESLRFPTEGQSASG